MCYHFAKFCIYTSYLIPPADDIDNVITPILQTGKLNFQEAPVVPDSHS